MESFFAYGFTPKKCFDFMRESKFFQTLENYQTLTGLFTIPLFSVFAYGIEKLATTRCPRLLIFLLIITNLICLLIFPIAFSYHFKSNQLAATYFILYTTTTVLKLASFHHVNHDVRKLVKKVNEAKN
jgi:hypothetical protein